MIHAYPVINNALSSSNVDATIFHGGECMIRGKTAFTQ